MLRSATNKYPYGDRDLSHKIAVLDGYTLNPGDISWEKFEQIGKLTLHERTPLGQIISRSRGHDAILTNKVPLTAETFDELPELKYVGALSTGYDVVDVQAAADRNIIVTNVPTYGTNSVAQHATALMLELIRHVALHSQSVKEGKWTTNKDWCYALAPIEELTDKTLAIVGIGRIGRTFARIGAAMGMRLIAHDEYWPAAEQMEGLEVESVELDEVFRCGDAISLHCPLTPATDRLVNAQRLAMMKPTAILINTSRGPLIDNQDLADALRNGVIAGAGVDVLDVEPPPADHPLIGAPNCFVTPHISWYARGARQRLMDIAADSYKAFLDGNPINVVN